MGSILQPKVQAPPERDYAKETKENLQAQIDLAPDLYGAESSEEYGQPAYARLGLRTLEESLMGNEDNRGLLEIYRDSVTPSMARTEAEANRIARESSLEDVERYGARARAALLESDPLLKRASDLAMNRALEGMDKEHDLRRFRQGLRGAQTARGMAYQPFAAAEESYFSGQEQEARDQRRLMQLQQAMGQRQALTGDPFMQILGRPGQAFGAAQGFGQQGFALGQTAPRLYSPESQYGADLRAGNQQTFLGAQAAQAQARAGVMGGLFQGLGMWAGGAASS